MKVMTIALGLFVGLSASAGAQDLTWRKDIQPIIAAKCGMCHGSDKAEVAEWEVLRVKDKSLAPRMDTYGHFMHHVVWPATGSMMRRLDDGKGSSAGKPGNMYTFLGADDKERSSNLAKIKAWLGDGAWNLNRWEKRGDTPGITKDQLDKVKAKY